MRLLFSKLLSCCLFLTCSVAFAQTQPFQIKVTPLIPKYYVHTSYKAFNNNPFPSNGLIVETKDGILLVDSAWGDDQTAQLLKWVKKHLKKPVKMVIVTHSHDDRIGGIKVLQANKIPVYSTALTADKAEKEGLPKPDGLLPVDSTFTVGGVVVQSFFPGEGHTADNIVVYFPQQGILFGGCLVKSTEAKNLGNVADANLSQWGPTIQNVINHFPDLKTVVPGHQAWGDGAALTHTLQLLEKGK